MSFSKISVALVVATIAVTVAIALLLVASESRDGRFYLSLGFILLAELFLFAGPHLVRTGGGVTMAPWHIAMSAIPVAYAIGVAGITAAAIWNTPWRILVSAQLAWLLMFVIALVMARSAGTRIAAGLDRDTVNRSSFAGVTLLLDDVFRRCERIGGDSVTGPLNQLRRLREDMRYSAQDSLPAAVPFDSELSAGCVAMNATLERLERDAADPSAFQELAGQIQIARQVLERREHAIARART